MGNAFLLYKKKKIAEVFLPFESGAFGVRIDTTNPNTETAVTYTDESTGFTPAKMNFSTNSFSYGSWGDKFPFNQIKPCVLKNGVVQYYLNPNDYTKKMDGSNADITSGNDGDVMIEFPKVYWKFETAGKYLYIRYSNTRISNNYKCLAHMRGTTEKEKVYISAYRGYSLSNRLRSLSGKTLTLNQSITTYRTQAQNNGTSYDQMAYYQLLMLQVLFLIMFKNRNSQDAIGLGYTLGNSASTTSGNTNTKGLFYGENTGKQQMKFCGIEDFWGNALCWIDGLFSNSNRNILIGNQNFNNTGSGYIDYGQGASSDIAGFIQTVQGGTETGFIIKTGTSDVTVNYTDYGNLYASGLPLFGGNRAIGTSSGAFLLYIYYTGSYTSSDSGSRLMYC